MGQRGARSTADAVATGSPAHQDYRVSGGRRAANHLVRRGGAHHRAAFQALGPVARVVHLANQGAGQAELVSVAGIALGGAPGDEVLGEFSGPGSSGGGEPRIAAAAHPQGLVHVHPSRKGIPNRAAEAGGGAAVRFDFRGMVVGFVLEREEPGAALTVDKGVHLQGAGVDFFAELPVIEAAPAPGLPGGDGGEVHEGSGPPRPLGVLPGHVPLIQGVLDFPGPGSVFYVDGRQLGFKGGVATVVGPIGIENLEFRQIRIPLFVLYEPSGDEFQIGGGQGDAVLPFQPVEARFAEFTKAGENGDVRGPGGGFPGIGSAQVLFTGLHRVDQPAANTADVFLGEGSGEQEDIAAIHRDSVSGNIGMKEAQHPGGGIRTLIELTGEVLPGDHEVKGIRGRQGGEKPIPGGFEETPRGRGIDPAGAEAEHIVAGDASQGGDSGYAERAAKLTEQIPRFGVPSRCPFYVDSPVIRHRSLMMDDPMLS